MGYILNGCSFIKRCPMIQASLVTFDTERLWSSWIVNRMGTSVYSL